MIAICIDKMNTIDGPTKLIRQDAIFGGLSVGQWGTRESGKVDIGSPCDVRHKNKQLVEIRF